MVSTINSTAFKKHSVATADLIVHVKGFYSSARRLTNDAVFMLVLPFAAGVAWLFFWNVRRKLRRSYPKNVELNFSNYKELRQEFDILSFVTQRVENTGVLKYPIQVIPYVLRGIVKIIHDLYDLVQMRRNNLAKAFQQMNDSAPVTDILQPASEEHLWNRRTKAYQYRF